MRCEMPALIIERMSMKWIAFAAIAVAAGLAAGCGGSDSSDFRMMQLGPGMMGYGATGSGEPVQNLAGAKRQAQGFADRLDLGVGEVMRFENNYYAELIDQSGELATEVLVDPRTGGVWLEYGPAMMWNTEWGMMGGAGGMGGGMMGGGMMGGGPYGDPSWGPTQALGDGPTLSAEDAELIASEWLSAQGRDLSAGEAEPFPGYYTLHVLRNEKIAGMLSVNGYTGALWYHWWHGRFVAMT